MERQPRENYDVAVIGGGIHGVSMACEAASRGLSVVLLQARDIAAGASSATSTMLSGDLRKVEQLAWFQVRGNLREQQLLLQRAPHLVHCRPYYIVPDAAVRSQQRLRMLLWAYRRLAPTNKQQAGKHTATGEPRQCLRDPEAPLLQYYDCSGLDYRLTVVTALQARAWGADIFPRRRVVDAHRRGRTWTLSVEPQGIQNAKAFSINAKCVINSCGWLANDLLNKVLKRPSRVVANPVSVGYLILPKTFPGDTGFVLQAEDRRPVYVTPLLDNYLLIGPALAPKEADRQTAAEALVALYNRHFDEPVSAASVIHQRWSRHAVFEDPSSRSVANQLGEAILDLNNPYGQAPLLNVFGINVLRHRLLAERGLNILQPFTGKPVNPQLKQQRLPGAEGFRAHGDSAAELAQAYPALNEHLIYRLARTYGSLSYQILGERRTLADVGEDFGHHLYEAEVRYLQQNEWAYTAEDILWRRTQLGIRFSAAEAQRLDNWLAANP